MLVSIGKAALLAAGVLGVLPVRVGAVLGLRLLCGALPGLRLKRLSRHNRHALRQRLLAPRQSGRRCHRLLLRTRGRCQHQATRLQVWAGRR